MLMHLLSILLNLLGEYHVANYPDEVAGRESLFSRFFKANTGMTPSEYKEKG